MQLCAVMQDVLAQRVASRHLRAIQKMVFFHGTGIHNLPKILKQGLVANSGAIWSGGHSTALTKGQKAVFLTSDFELAARYGQGTNRSYLPVVLEVQITTPRRFRNLKYDPLDRLENSWEVEDSYDDTVDQAGSAIKAGMRDIATKLTGQSVYLGWDDLPHDIEELDGLNVFKFVAGYLTKALGLSRVQRNLVMQQAQALFGGQRWEYLEVRKDGTLKLTEEYFYTREQLMYMKGLPPSTVKGVWVRLQDFDVPEAQIKETRKGGFKELPGESADRFESLKELLGKLRWTTPEEIEDDLEDFARQARELDYLELASYLDDVAGLDPEERAAVEEWDGELEGFEEFLHDDWMQERVLESGLWAKVPLQVAARLRPRDTAEAAG